jgi:hypothetical protein
MEKKEENICEHPCFYYSQSRQGPMCSYFGTLRPKKKMGECPKYIPNELAERAQRQEVTTTKLLVEMLDSLTKIKIEQIEKIPDAELREKLREIVLLAKQIRSKG